MIDLARYEDCDCGGEHHTTGDRAWCLDCHEWCYPTNKCEIQALREDVMRLTTVLAELLDAQFTADRILDHARGSAREALNSVSRP